MIPYLKGLPASTFNNFYNKLPYTGRQDYFGSISSIQNFGPALVIKLVPFRDMSMDYSYNETDFDKLMTNVLNNLPIGSQITALLMNTVKNQKGGKMISGQVSRIVPDYENQLLRIYVIDRKTGSEVEVYPESIFRELERNTISVPDTQNIFDL